MDVIDLELIKDCCFMDLENEMIHYYGRDFPKGKQRYKNKKWKKLIKDNIDQTYTFKEYKRWVKDGGGETWFDSDEEGDEDIIDSLLTNTFEHINIQFN